MSKKCPNCGFGCGEYDVFCAKCGHRLDIGRDETNEFEELKKAALNNAKEFYSDRKRTALNESAVNFKQAKFTDSPVFNFALCVLITACILAFVLYVTISGHNNKKEELRYKNLISNPAQIPELKEPSNFKELTANFYPVVDFLNLYLKFSKDSLEKKQQVFESYLNEVEKLPHLTNEALIDNDFDTCKMISNPKRAKYCVESYDKRFESIGIQAQSDGRLIYFYPNYEFINKKYSKYLSKQMKEYLALRAKYNTPSGMGLDLFIAPKELAQKIADFEKLYLFNSDLFVKETAERIIYEDFRRFIFTPAIYNTTTQEMAPVFKKTYNYYISSFKTSALRPCLMSYLDKQRSYNESNFKSDYPYKNFEDNLAETIQASTFKDVFAQLRKGAFADNSEAQFAYIFDGVNNSWKNYSQDVSLIRGQFVISEADENKNVTIYNHALSLVQEINISRFSKLFLYKNSLYVYNSDKLALSKILFNGRQFTLQDLSFSDITSLFPGVEIISIDSYSNYNIQIDKDNQKASYIILTRYSRGYEQYTLSVLKGSIGSSVLPNMFSVSSNEDVVVSFHGRNVNPEETSESVPTYKFVIHTRGHQSAQEAPDNSFAQYDEQTAIEEKDQKHEANMMPKIINKNGNNDGIATPPQQKIEPPKEEE